MSIEELSLMDTNIARKLKLTQNLAYNNRLRLSSLTSNAGSFRIMPELVNIVEQGNKILLLSPLLMKLYRLDKKIYEKLILGNFEPYTKEFLKSNLIVPDNVDLYTNEEPFNLKVLLNKKCNLKCIYCFTSCGGNRPSPELDEEFVKSVMDYLFEKGKKDISVGFPGLGEPTLSLEKMKNICEYAKEKFKRVDTSITTNGTYSEKTSEWLIENMDVINVSVDGPPSIQNLQRPFRNGRGSSDVVEKNLKRLIEGGKEFVTCSIITKYSITKQKEIVDYFHSLGVKILYFNLPYKIGRAYEGAVFPENYREVFTKNFLSAWELVKDYGMDLFGGVATVFSPTQQRCDLENKLDIMPDGRLIRCLMMTASSEMKNPLEKYNELQVKTTDRGLEIVEKRDAFFEKILKRNIHTIKECSYCPIKWLCGSGCPIKSYLDYGEFFRPGEECETRKNFIKEQLTLASEKKFIALKPWIEKDENDLKFRMYYNTYKLKKIRQGGEINSSSFITLNDFSNLGKVMRGIVATDRKAKFGNKPLFLLSFSRIPRKGHDVESLLELAKQLKEKKIFYKITKPLPPCVLKASMRKEIDELPIPKSCYDCLELFMVRGNKMVLCNGETFELKHFTDRKQVFEKLEPGKDCCNGCLYLLRGICKGNSCL